ncbi:MAG: hypothetical protein HXX18_14905 [Bacteroidetes bacterium]|nr:hypothetical protein [Bacteroidota bacterium]
MSDELTKPIEEIVEVPTIDSEPIEGVNTVDTEGLASSERISEPVTEPVVEPTPSEPISEVVSDVPVIKPNVTSEPITVSDPVIIPEPEVVVSTESVPIPVKEPKTIQQETASYSSNPKLNSAALAFINYMGRAKETLALANKKRKEQMMKRVYRVMDLFKKKQKIKNDDVEKFIHTDDSTATKYLNILVKEGKIKEEGKTHTPLYTKVE